MPHGHLHPEIKLEAGDLLEALEASGWEISASMYEATFCGDWFVDLCRGEKFIRLMKKDELFTIQKLDDTKFENENLEQPFASFHLFEKAVTQWART